MNRKQIQRRIVKLFYRMGIYIDIEFFPSVEKLYNRISHKPAQKQVAELEKICSAVSAAKDHYYYNQLLKKFIPNWNLSIKKAEFLGTGQWSGFNSFRLVKIDERSEFEKLFDTSTGTLSKLIWLEENLFPLLTDSIKTPKILRYYPGEVLSLAYFEFVDAPQLPEKQGTDLAITLSKKLYRFSLQSDFSKLSPPSALKDFTRYSRYKMWIPQAEKELAANQISRQAIEERIDTARKILTHGDLKDLNLFEDGSLIDWDEAGFYPAGLEQAFIYSRNILHYDLVDKSATDWLQQHFKSTVPPDEWAVFKLSFVYFLFIFSFEKLQEERYAEMKKSLLDFLKNPQTN